MQSLTLDEIVVDMKGGRFSPGQAYVAVSRIKTREGLHILNFNRKAIKKSLDVEKEMVRLNSNLLQPIPQVMCNSISCSHLVIALLNVRSLVAKLPDVISNNSLMSVMSAGILCFCETWLNPSQPSPVLKNDMVDIRYDRLTCENKGGVIMYVPSQMHPTNLHRFATNGIEAVSATLELPNGSHIQVALLYRSPSLSLTALTPILLRLLTNLSVYNTPCVVLGDFNEDLLSQQSSTIKRLCLISVLYS